MLARKSDRETIVQIWGQRGDKAIAEVKSPAAFASWLERAHPGDKALYHVGDLASDREMRIMFPNGKYAQSFWEPIHSLALAVYNAFEDGLVHLVQVRRVNGSIGYFAVRSRKRRISK